MKGKGYKALSKFNKFAFVLNILCITGLLLAYISTYVNPEKVTFMAFFGLLYPVFLFPTLGFLVYWFFKKKRQFLWSLIAIVIGLTHFSHFFQFTLFDGNDEKLKNEIKVMSYNVRLFDLYNWTKNKETRNQIFDFLREEDPDVICFQEFYRQDRNDWEFKTRDSLVQFLQAKFYSEGYSVNLRNKEYFGLCTLSKYPILEDDMVRFENDPSNSFIYSDLLINGIP
ncbi:MAG: endonuclease/exonuclease/phosphatase family protein [Flavobacteriales bacterium]|nr:endonuclease/exonuclease/phosphatase family protein [Flavobacteriales bacterium]